MSLLNKPVIELAVALWLAVCGWLDARTGRVPNWLTNPLMVVAVVAATTSVPAFGFLLVVAAFSIGLWKSGQGVGGADAKVLIALAGLWPDGCIAATLSLALFGLARAVWSKWRPMPPTFPAVAVMACGVCFSGSILYIAKLLM
ncbi:MAG: prepilin peptidase [Chloroflexi bacterium]|nr:prepilin peptidase [Chloroflexota bacterium]